MSNVYENYQRESMSLPMFKFDRPGDTLIGKLIEMEATSISGTGFAKYSFVDANSDRWRVFGSFQLDDALSRFRVGEIAEIIYEGEEQGPSGYPTKRYNVNRLREA